MIVRSAVTVDADIINAAPKLKVIGRAADHVRRVKRYETGMIVDPITVNSDTSIEEVINLTDHHQISGVPVLKDGKLFGIVTNRDLRFVKEKQRPISDVMTPQDRLITVKEGASDEEVQALLHQYRIEKILVVDNEFNLKGLVTVKDMQKSKDYPNACKDENGSLRVAAAIGVGDDADERVEKLIKAGVDAIVVDTAHGHSSGVIERVRMIKTQYPDAQVIADKKSVDVVVDELQLSQAIGRGGQNVRLVAELVKWSINIMTDDQANKKSEDEENKTIKEFVEQLEIDEDIAQILSVRHNLTRYEACQNVKTYYHHEQIDYLSWRFLVHLLNHYVSLILSHYVHQVLRQNANLILSHYANQILLQNECPIVNHFLNQNVSLIVIQFLIHVNFDYRIDHLIGLLKSDHIDDEAGYADILKQLHDQEFKEQLNERLKSAEQDKLNAVELATT
eukprot:snap_masked-scaffold413_size178717-processed-gene-0.0 protein:Tk03118 transcript:snap_masked-scaffold413_size178717-processed-gene-0.0-mRNA-1 annotation:"inosine 5 -monophosphate dehydrogenase"